MVVDAIIVGGGLSGLSAAYNLQKAGKSLILLEARDRIGGRTYSIDTLSGGRADLGGAWFNEYTQHSITELIREAEIPFFEQSIRGIASLELSKDALRSYNDHGTFALDSTMSKEAIMDEKRVVALMNELSQLVDLYEPWKCSRAEEFDSMSIMGWLNSVGALETTKISLQAFFRCLFALDMNDISFLYTLHYLVSGGGYKSLASNDETGGQFQRMRNGSMSVSHYLASKLSPESLVLSSPVESITQDISSGICTVTSRSGGVFQSRTVICALSAVLYSSFQWSPMLPIERRCLAQRSFLGICSKLLLFYSTAWWREAGRSGTSSSAVGPILQTMDTCDGIWGSSDPLLKPRQFSLTCFMAGNLGVHWAKLPEEERILVVKRHVGKLFENEKAAMDTIQVIEKQWMNEEFSMGAPVAALGCGALTSVGTDMRAAHGRVFFAGTEVALYWKGYMDGAVSAGKYAAGEALTVINETVNGVH